MKKDPYAAKPLLTYRTTNVQISKPAYFFLSLLLIFLTGCGRPPASTPEPTAAGASSVVISTVTAASTDLLSPDVPTLTLEPTLDEKVTGQLPGLSPRNVTVSLEDQNFTCTEVRKGAVYYERTCSRGVPGAEVFLVAISGRTPAVVDLIEASILQYESPDNEKAIPILSLIASLPYDGAASDEARAWVESTVPVLSGAQEQVFGGVSYVLSGPPTALKLEMGELP
jgi:hypothetical protein